MGERIQWHHFEGKKILKLDYSELTDEQVIQQQKKVADFYRRHAILEVLSIVDVNKVQITKSAVAGFKNLAQETKHQSKAIAILGVTGLKEVIVNSLATLTGSNIKTFADETEAHKWLASV